MSALFFADFETTTSRQSSDSTRVWIWGIKGNLPGDVMEFGLDLNSFFDHVSEKKIKEIYFHNLSFDGNFMFKHMLKTYKSHFKRNSPEDRIALEENEWSGICDDMGNIYSMEFNHKGHLMTFYDSGKVLMASVKDLGKSLGKPKLDMDYDLYSEFKRKEDVPKIALEYLERDIDVVIEAFTKVTEIYDKKLTRASMAYSNFMEFYGDRQFARDFGGMVKNFRSGEREWRNVLTGHDWELGHSTYQGGYVNWNKEIEGKTVENIDGVSYDVNSLYPSVMMNYPMPYGRLLSHKPVGTTYETIVTVYIRSAVKKNPKAPNLLKDRSKGLHSLDDKYLAEVYDEIRSFGMDEWNFITDHYDCDFYIIKKKYIRTKFIFREGLEELNHGKVNAKDETEANFHKGIFNSLYGKFCQHGNVVERVIIEDRDMKYPKRERYGAEGEYTYDTVKLEKPNEKTRFKHIFVGSRVTWLSRKTLGCAIFPNLDIWLYSDTDSCYYKGNPVGIDVHESRFGAGKPEYRFNMFKVVRAKTYMFHSTMKYSKKTKKMESHNEIVKKVAGLGEEGKKQLTFDNFARGLTIESGKKASKSVDGGKLILEVKYTIGEL